MSHPTHATPTRRVRGHDARHELTFGVEEEFFLVDASTHRLMSDVPRGFAHACRVELGDRVGEELLRPQVELVSPVLHGAQEARSTLIELRQALAQVASRFGMSLLAAGTHPSGAWEEQKSTNKARYAKLIDDFQIVGRRNLCCGLHVHVGVPEGYDRVEVMNRVMPWLPALLSLSTSSPFWNGRRTGLLSYRQSAYDEWPRSGIPDSFSNEAEYEAFIRLLISCGALIDGSYLWWAIRPSARYPTLELRIADACTRVEDALAIAAAFRCLVRAHLRQPGLGMEHSAMTRRVIEENRWRAKRYGTDAEFIDESAGTTSGFSSTLDALLETVALDACALKCESELAHLRTIVRRGTSAHTQLAIYRAARGQCRTREQAVSAVAGWLTTATVALDAPTAPLSAGPRQADAIATA